MKRNELEEKKKQSGLLQQVGSRGETEVNELFIEFY